MRAAPSDERGRHRRSTATTAAVEDYAKALYSVGCRGDVPVRTSALAHHLGVSPASASTMLKRLAKLGLVDRAPYRGVRLTAAGEGVASVVLRHHRLLELYLVDVLGMPPDRVHDEAEVLEHYLSDELERSMLAHLGQRGSHQTLLDHHPAGGTTYERTA